MANLFMDYLSGNNANAGTTFALRFKDITSGATAARIAPGDVIRIMKSPDPTSLGIDGTWTEGSSVVTLASALTANITDCESVWTASANVTATTSATRKEGSLAASLSLATAFTTGKAAYFATGSLDLSAYQQVSFWVRTSSAVANNTTLSLRLCTDTTGDTSVHTIAIPALPAANTWNKVTVDLATNLNAAIQSVALYQDTDRAAAIILLDNIIACKASGSADSLSLTSLIRKTADSHWETGEIWYPIASINGTTVCLDISTNTLPSAQRGYGGETGTVATSKRETLKTGYAAAASTAVQTVQDSGTSGNPITYSGGWDTTDMTTQDGETWFDAGNGMGIGLSIANRSYITLNNIRFVNYGNAGVSVSGTSNNIMLNDVVCAGNTLDGVLLSASGSGGQHSTLLACNNGRYGVNNSGGQTYNMTGSLANLVLDGNASGAASGFSVTCSGSGAFDMVRSSCNGGNGVSINGAGSPSIANLTGSYNTGSYGLSIVSAPGGYIATANANNNTGARGLEILSTADIGGIGFQCDNNSNVGAYIGQSDLIASSYTVSDNLGTGVYIDAPNVALSSGLVSGNETGVYIGGADCTLTYISFMDSNTLGVHFASTGCVITNIDHADSNGTALMFTGANNRVVEEISGDGNTIGVVFGAGGNRNMIGSLVLTNTVATGIDWGYGENNVILSGSQSGGTQGMLANTGTGTLYGFAVSNATEMGSATPTSEYRIASVKHDGTAGNHKVFCDGGLLSSGTSVRHTASGLAWEMSPTSTSRTASRPLKMSLGLYALAAGTVTIKCWLRRTNTGLTAKLVAPVNTGVGIATAVSASMTASADTWEELSISVSPTADGVIQIEVHCYGGTTYTCFVDDLTVNGVAVPLDYSWKAEPFCSPLVSAGASSGEKSFAFVG